MPNALKRFRIVVGWPKTILCMLVLLAMLASATISIVLTKGSDWPVWFLPGLVLGALLRPLLLIKPSITHQALKAVWVALVLFVVVRKALSSPPWVLVAMAITSGAYIAACFMFYSSLAMYVATLMHKHAPSEESQ